MKVFKVTVKSPSEHIFWKGRNLIDSVPFISVISSMYFKSNNEGYYNIKLG